MTETNWGVDFLNDCFGQNKSKEPPMPDLNEQMRETVDDALEIVSTWGPYGRDINDGMRCAIVLAEEVQRLRRQHGSAAQATEARPVAETDARTARLLDSQYRAGFNAGWNAGQTGDEDALRRANESVGTRAEYEAAFTAPPRRPTAEPDGTLINEGTMPAAAGNALTEAEIVAAGAKTGVFAPIPNVVAFGRAIEQHLRAAPQAAPEWVPVSRAGQVKVGDKLRFTIGDKQFNQRAKQILHAGTDKEEVIYDKGRNFYFITSCVLSGWSNHKNVEVLAAHTRASDGKNGELFTEAQQAASNQQEGA